MGLLASSDFILKILPINNGGRISNMNKKPPRSSRPRRFTPRNLLFEIWNFILRVIKNCSSTIFPSLTRYTIAVHPLRWPLGLWVVSIKRTVKDYRLPWVRNLVAVYLKIFTTTVLFLQLLHPIAHFHGLGHLDAFDIENIGFDSLVFLSVAAVFYQFACYPSVIIVIVFYK